MTKTEPVRVHPARSTARTLAELLDHFDDGRADERLVFPGTGRTLPHREIPGLAWGVADALLRLGVAEGVPVGLLLGPAPDFVPAAFGVWAAGGAITVLPVTPMPTPAREVATRLAPGIDGLRYLVFSDANAEIARELLALRPDLITVRVRDCASAAVRPARSVTRPDAPAIVQFTSGTTARPKGVVLSHRAVLACFAAIAAASTIGPQDRVVSWVPLFHDFGLITLLYGLWQGYEHHVFGVWRFIRRPREVVEYLSAHRATVFGSPDFGYDRIASACAGGRANGLDLRSWRLALNGGEPVKPGTAAAFASALRPAGLAATAMLPVYGMAEAVLSVACPRPGTPPVVAWLDRDHLAQRQRAVAVPAGSDNGIGLVSVGRAVPGLDLRLRDEHGGDAADGEVGEIVLRGPTLADGYLDLRENTVTPILREGWLHTGDLGVRVDGELYIAGRAKDMIIVAGRNFFAEDVEDVVRAGLPGGRGDCVAVADQERERMIVVVEAGGRVAADDLASRLWGLVSQRLELGALDVHVVPRNTLFRTTSGKVRRGLTARHLRAMLES